MVMMALRTLSACFATAMAGSIAADLKQMRIEVTVDHTGRQSTSASQQRQVVASTDITSIDSPIVQIAAGSQTSFLLTKKGEVYATGANTFGQLGDGTKANKQVFTKVLEGMKYVSAAEKTSLFLASNGTAYAAGINGNPAIVEVGGTAKRVDHSKDVGAGITPPMRIMDDVKQVAAGRSFHVFMKTNGEVQLTGWQDTPLKVMDKADGILSEPYPLYLHNNEVHYTKDASKKAEKWTDGVLALASGPHSTFFFPSNGSHLMVEFDWNTWITYALATSEAMQSVAAGDGWGIILTTGGVAYTIGKNGYGQLCDGTTTDHKAFFKAASDVVAVSAGWYHALLLKKDGTVLACGKNDVGELGVVTTSLAEMDSTGMSSPTEVLKSPPVNVADLVATPSRGAPASAPAPAKSATPCKLAAAHSLAAFIGLLVLAL